jgi:hypothetical protein
MAYLPFLIPERVCPVMDSDACHYNGKSRSQHKHINNYFSDKTIAFLRKQFPDKSYHNILFAGIKIQRMPVIIPKKNLKGFCLKQRIHLSGKLNMQ